VAGSPGFEEEEGVLYKLQEWGGWLNKVVVVIKE
jgi:hypothetical protein